MTKIIDNSKLSLASVLRDEMRHVDELAIASAYFNLEGYRNIREVLKNKPLKLLLGLVYHVALNYVCIETIF